MYSLIKGKELHRNNEELDGTVVDKRQFYFIVYIIIILFAGRMAIQCFSSL